MSKEESEKHKKHKTEEDAFGTYASKGGKEFVYRERKAGAFGGYRIIKETNTGDKSREDLLNMRSKKKADRFVVHF